MRIKYQVSSYTRRIVSISIALLTACALLAFVLYTNGPRVRLVSFDKDPKQFSVQRNSQITIVFDRPLENADYTDQISFEPKVSFSARTATQSIIVTLDENFKHETEYILMISNKIYDKTGRQMQSAQTHTFTTGSPRYAYIERNYGMEFDEDIVFSDVVTDQDDHVKIARLGEDSEIVFSAPEISRFAANSDYVVVATREQESDRLFMVDLKVGETREITMLNTGRVNSLALSPQGKTALYTTIPEFGSVDAETFTNVAHSLESVDLEDAFTMFVSYQSGEVLRSYSEISYSPNGQAALIKSDEQQYYAVSPFNDFDPILIGSRTASFGFSQDGSEIVFSDNNTYSRYDVESGQAQSYDFNTDGFIQSIFSTDSGVLYSSIEYLRIGAISTINYLEGWDDDTATELWSNASTNTLTLTDFSVSNDNLLLALQKDSRECSFDPISTNSQCVDTRTELYDYNNDEVLESFRGFGTVWLP